MSDDRMQLVSAQQRLGVLVNRKREPFDEVAARKELEEGIAVLRQLGVEPGSERAGQLLDMLG